MSGNFCSATRALWKREVIRFVRQPSRLIGALATPLMFWFIVGGGLSGSFRDQSSGSNYFEFFFPGAITLSVLFTAIFSTISVIEDRHQGFLQGVLVSPVPRSAIVASKVLGGATMGLLQGLLLLILGPLVGVHYGVLSFCGVLLILFLMASCLTSLGFLFAWKIDSVQGYHGIMNMVLMPMWMLSGSLFPIQGGMKLFTYLSAINPLTYGVNTLRALLWRPSEQGVFSQFLVSTGVLIVVTGLFFFLAQLLVVGSKGKSAASV
jgi:ABC-2 type transport system permease protein